MADDRQHPRPPLPLTIPPVIHCNFCRRQIMAQPMEPGGYRFVVEHPDLHPVAIELNVRPESEDAMSICPNNGKRWIVEFQQPWIYEMDPVTGEIDTFGGRVI